MEGGEEGVRGRGGGEGGEEGVRGRGGRKGFILSLSDLHDNPWSCDCRLGWIADFLDTNPALLLSDAETVCLWPPSNLDMPISGLATADFICGEQ